MVRLKIQTALSSGKYSNWRCLKIAVVLCGSGRIIPFYLVKTVLETQLLRTANIRRIDRSISQFVASLQLHHFWIRLNR